MNPTIVRHIQPEPIIQVSRPGGYTNYTVAEAERLRDDLMAAIREAKGHDKVDGDMIRPRLRVGARVVRSACGIVNKPRFSRGTEGVVSDIGTNGVTVSTPDGVAYWSNGNYDVIG